VQITIGGAYITIGGAIIICMTNSLFVLGNTLNVSNATFWLTLCVISGGAVMLGDQSLEPPAADTPRTGERFQIHGSFLLHSQKSMVNTCEQL
jgi:hypothetical protein